MQNSGTVSTIVCLNADCNPVFAARKMEKKTGEKKKTKEFTELLASECRSQLVYKIEITYEGVCACRYGC